MTLDMQQFRQVFMDECAENLDIMEQELLALNPDSVDPETINTIFRAAHSIKGGAATFDFNTIASFTHVVETLLDEIRNNNIVLCAEHVDLFLKSEDHIRNLLEAAQQGEDLDPKLGDDLIKQLELCLDPDAEQLITKQEPVESSADIEVEAEQEWHISFAPHPEMLFSGNEPIRILRELQELCSEDEYHISVITEKVPDYDELDVEKCFLAWHILLPHSVELADIKECFDWVEDECDLKIEALNRMLDAEQVSNHCLKTDIPVKSEASSEEQSSEVAENLEQTTKDEKTVLASQAASAKEVANFIQKSKQNTAQSQISTANSSIRVDTQKIDTLINLVGELVITQSMLNQLGSDFTAEKLPRLRQGLDQLLSNTKELQESVLAIRMLPISFAFNRFPRLVRDLATKTEKKVELRVSGENTELDKTVMEQIVDPLVHLVRNSVDHGLESPEERIALGKEETGLVSLNAYHLGGNIIIEVSDDGKGLNKEVLWQKAIEKNLPEVKGKYIDDVDEQQIFELIFAAGFSTAQEVSDLSGRGVGMDVVKRNITNLGGIIDVVSKLGQGTTIRISLPLTLAILDGQLVKVGTEIFIIPLTAVLESVEVDSNKINIVSSGTELYRLRQENLPIISLAKTFMIEGANPTNESLLCVVEVMGQKVGLLVDELYSQQQVVIKSLESNYVKIDGFSGATILGDGSVSLILDVPGLVGHVLKNSHNQLNTSH